MNRLCYLIYEYKTSTINLLHLNVKLRNMLSYLIYKCDPSLLKRDTIKLTIK